MEWTAIGATIGTGIGVVSLVYTFIRNFKVDIKTDLKGINDKLYSIEGRISHIEGYQQGKEQERIFYEIRKTGTEEKK